MQVSVEFRKGKWLGSPKNWSEINAHFLTQCTYEDYECGENQNEGDGVRSPEFFGRNVFYPHINMLPR
jgi:hypothetical protein